MVWVRMSDDDIAAYLAGMMYCIECQGRPWLLLEMIETGPMYCAQGWFDALHEMGWLGFEKRCVKIK